MAASSQRVARVVVDGVVRETQAIEPGPDDARFPTGSGRHVDHRHAVRHRHRDHGGGAAGPAAVGAVPHRDQDVRVGDQRAADHLVAALGIVALARQLEHPVRRGEQASIVGARRLGVEVERVVVAPERQQRVQCVPFALRERGDVAVAAFGETGEHAQFGRRIGEARTLAAAQRRRRRGERAQDALDFGRRVVELALADAVQPVAGHADVEAAARSRRGHQAGDFAAPPRSTGAGRRCCAIAASRAAGRRAARPLPSARSGAARRRRAPTRTAPGRAAPAATGRRGRGRAARDAAPAPARRPAALPRAVSSRARIIARRIRSSATSRRSSSVRTGTIFCVSRGPWRWPLRPRRNPEPIAPCPPARDGWRAAGRSAPAAEVRRPSPGARRAAAAPARGAAPPDRPFRHRAAGTPKLGARRVVDPGECIGGRSRIATSR